MAQQRRPAAPVTTARPGSSPVGRIEVRSVSKRYQTRGSTVEALKGVSFVVEGGEFVSLLGPSGCGKSTLLMMFAGLLPPSDGSIRVDGQVIDRPQTDIGIVFQNPVLLDWRTAVQNVLLQADIRRLDKQVYRWRALELIAAMGLGGFEDKHPFELSGGMQQRVAICRALIHEPPLLLMDEPFSSLDALTRDQLNLDLQRIWQEHSKTVVFVTHSVPEAVFLSDRVIVMSPRSGTVEEIIEIDLPRPRRLEVRESAEFAAHTRAIRSIFEARGVLR